jgi:diguanylate cyclase (GGDEF)-like protein/PAS domain S-box-containing protein
MLSLALDYRLDAVVFIAVSVAGALLVDRKLRRRHHAPGLPKRSWMLLLGILACGTLLAEANGLRERIRLQSMLEGYAPTYARELERMGHGALPDDCAADDPRYLAVIDAELRWLSANPSVADIYTVRRGADGAHFFLVDSETDYDRDGDFDGDTEARTEIGEVMDSDQDLLEEAFSGRCVFAGRPTSDRWGTWVSAYAPMYGPNGVVEAVVGVDYEATHWVLAILWSRCSALGFFAMMVALQVASSSVMQLTRSELEQRRRAESAARASEAKVRTILDSEPECVLIMGRDLRIQEINPAGMAVLEAEDIEQVRRMDPLRQLLPDFVVPFRELHLDALAGRGRRLRFALRSLKGNLRWVDQSSVPLRDGSGRIESVLSIARDVTAQVQADVERQQLQRMLVDQLRTEAMEDKLTALPNRRLFTERLARALDRANAEPGHHAAVLFLDFDRFKVINDSLGHEIGDLLLVDIAQRLRSSLADDPCPGDKLAARLGGDEFILLIEGIGAAQDAARVAGRLLRSLARPYTLKGHEVHTTASIGITTTHVGYSSADQIIRDADTAMYRAKAAGKGRYVLFDQHMHEEAMARLTMESELRHAIERGELFLQYQPIMSLESGATAGFEALVRWRRADGSVVPPQRFIPLAEEIGQIVPIGLWVLRAACVQLAEWHREPALAGLAVSVNLSRKQLSAPDLVSQIRRVLSQTQVDPRRLKLEITESTMMEDPDLWQHVLGEIRELGIALHMDDFGTGYSSLSCLHRFPIDGVKIDRAFINNVGDRRDYAAVVHAIISLAHNLNISLVAEGVETADQVAMLQALGCDLAQGFYFAQPLSAAAARQHALLRRPALAA